MVLAPIFYFSEFIFTPFFSPKLRFAPFQLSILCQNRNFPATKILFFTPKTQLFGLVSLRRSPCFASKLRISVHFTICNFMHFALRFAALLWVFWWFQPCVLLHLALRFGAFSLAFCMSQQCVFMVFTLLFGAKRVQIPIVYMFIPCRTNLYTRATPSSSRENKPSRELNISHRSSDW